MVNNLLFCRKCLVKTMCNKKCDKIRKILHLITIFQNSATVLLCLSWAGGFGVALRTKLGAEPTKVFILFIAFVILAMSIIFGINLLRSYIETKFGKDDHISKFC